MISPIARTDAGVVWLEGTPSTPTRVGRANGTTIIEWPGALRMIATPEMHSARLEPLTEDFDPSLLRKIELGFARAVPSYLRGAIVFHAAAVALGGKGLLVLGESGAGKSTAAALLCRGGAAMVADDTSIASFTNEGLVLEPLEDSHWLDARSRTALEFGGDEEWKQPVRAPRLQPTPVPVAAAVVLATSPGEPVAMERLHGLAAATALLDSALRIPFDRERSKYDLDAVARVGQLVPVYRVRRPSHFSAVAERSLCSVMLRLLSPEGS